MNMEINSVWENISNSYNKLRSWYAVQIFIMAENFEQRVFFVKFR